MSDDRKGEENGNDTQADWEEALFQSRWLLAPFYFVLIVSMIFLLLPMAVLLIRILVKIFAFCNPTEIINPSSNALSFYDLLVPILELVDVSLLGTLLIIIAFSGYHSFVSRVDAFEKGDGFTRREGADRPRWIDGIGFDDLKLKLMGVMVVITGLELLKDASLQDAHGENYMALAWKVIIHLTFVVSGVLFAHTERIAGQK